MSDLISRQKTGSQTLFGTRSSRGVLPAASGERDQSPTPERIRLDVALLVLEFQCAFGQRRAVRLLSVFWLYQEELECSKRGLSQVAFTNKAQRFRKMTNKMCRICAWESQESTHAALKTVRCNLCLKHFVVQFHPKALGLRKLDQALMNGIAWLQSRGHRFIPFH